MYNQDILEAYGFNPILSKPSYVEEFFNGDIKCIFSERSIAPKLIRDLMNRGEEHYVVDEDLPEIVYFWDKVPKPFCPQDYWDRHERNYRTSSEYILVKGKVLIDVPSIKVRCIEDPHLQVAQHLLTKLNKDDQNMRLFYRYYRSHKLSLSNNLFAFSIHDIRFPVDPDLIPFPDTTNIEDFADAHCLLPYYKIDLETKTLVKKTRAEMVKTISKFMVERNLIREFGNVSSMISTLDETLQSLIRVLNTIGMFPPEVSAAINDAPVNIDSTANLVKSINNFKRIDEIKAQTIQMVEGLVPQNGYWNS